MKIKITRGCLILAMLALLWFLVKPTKPTSPSEVPVNSKTFHANAVNSSHENHSDDSNTDTDKLVPPALDLKLLEEVRNWGKTPIVFYGKVVDEKSQAVSDALIRYSTTDLSPEGRTMREIRSSNDGTFSIQRVHGKNLVVRVTKDGYYEYQDARRGFQYAGPGDHFAPDKDKPEIFRLRKKGQQEPLIITGGSIKLPKDGTPVEISLLNGRQTLQGQGDLVVRAWSETDKKAPHGEFPWRFVFEVPQGGLQPSKEEFAFKAPESGYTTKLEQQFIPSTQGWRSRLEGSSFLKNRDGHYALVHWEMIPGGSHFIYLRSRLNPTGSRVLEADEKSWYEAVSKGQGVYELVLRHKPKPEDTR